MVEFPKTASGLGLKKYQVENATLEDALLPGAFAA